MWIIHDPTRTYTVFTQNSQYFLWFKPTPFYCCIDTRTISNQIVMQFVLNQFLVKITRGERRSTEMKCDGAKWYDRKLYYTLLYDQSSNLISGPLPDMATWLSLPLLMLLVDQMHLSTCGGMVLPLTQLMEMMMTIIIKRRHHQH